MITGLKTFSRDVLLPAPEAVDRNRPELAAALLEEASAVEGRVAYAETAFAVTGDRTVFEFATAESADLAELLRGSEKAVVFVATIGHEFDRLLNRYSKTSPASAYLLQRAGLIMAEKCCDEFMSWYASENGARLTERFSPGYGDLSLEFQRNIFSSLPAGKLAGVALTESLLMTPSKTVSAVFGVGGGNGRSSCPSAGNGCGRCIKKDLCE